MDQPNFVVVCSLALMTAFVLLAVLALAMRAITALFPERLGRIDATIVAAVASVVSTALPGARLAQVTEIPCSSQPAPRRSE